MEKITSLNSISSELQKLFRDDQADRTLLRGNWDNQELIQRMADNDRVRLQRAREIYNSYKLAEVSLTNSEKVHLAVLFQHSHEINDYWVAHELGEEAGEEGKWIAAAAEDRWLIEKGEKQKWGTQFISETEQAPMLSDEESGVTDEMRIEREIPARAEQLKVHQNYLNVDSESK